ncbi:regulator of chromosome condensation 1/beta-lactamase-inhibitor protein II [Pavlovales sp. CCMP2436]|nr:regulator of chromosome condensation 1/beta-lactamase-inhibitor protein II [Pavlovales sp. CCMP2436]
MLAVVLLLLVAQGASNQADARLAPLIQLLEIPTPHGDKIVGACAGDSHLAFLTRRGRLLTAGSNRFGQLGRSSAEAQPAEHMLLEAREVEVQEAGTPVPGSEHLRERLQRGREAESEPLLSFACGPLSTAVVARHRPYTFGDNSNFQLGRATTVGQMDRKPRPIELDLVGVSEYIGAAVTSSGQLYIWGAREEGDEHAGGEDGGGGSWHARRAQLELLRDEAVVQLVVGSAHVLVRTSAGRLLSAGDNDVGQLGRATGEDEPFDSLQQLHRPFHAIK